MVQQAVQQDEMVQREIRLASARFVLNGTDYNDVQRTLARISRWEDWCREWSATAAVHEERAKEHERQGHTISAGEAYIMAGVCYHWAKFRWVEDEAQYHEAHRKSVETFWKGLKYLDPTAERLEIPLENITMPAHLRRPQGGSRPPVVILLGGSDSIKEEFYYWAGVFLKRGMATLAMDGPGQGETRDKMPVRHDFEKAVSAAIDFLERRDDVDASTVGVIGQSMGGYYAPRAAAFDQRIKAAVALGGALKVTPSPELVQRVTRWQMFTHWCQTPEEVVEKAARRNLEGVISNIRCPLLVVAGKLDALQPWTVTEELARAAGEAAQFVLYEEGNHVMQNIPYKYQPLVGDWMAEHLRGR